MLREKIKKEIDNLSEEQLTKLANFFAINNIISTSDTNKNNFNNDFAIAILDGIRNQNHTMLFYLLCAALPKDSYKNSTSQRQGIKKAMVKIGLKINEVEKDSNLYADRLSSKIISSKIESISKLSKAGYQNFKEMYLYQSELNFLNLNLGLISSLKLVYSLKLYNL